MKPNIEAPTCVNVPATEGTTLSGTPDSSLNCHKTHVAGKNTMRGVNNLMFMEMIALGVDQNMKSANSFDYCMRYLSDLTHLELMGNDH
jgi:hypothetical protein